MTTEPDDEQQPYTPNLLDTKTAEVIAAIVAVGCCIGALVIVAAALLGVWPW